MYARVTFSQISPDAVDQAVDIVQDSIVPISKQQNGFREYILLFDRATGKSINITLWETEADREASDQASEYYAEAITQVAELFTAAPVVENFEADTYQ